MTPEETVDEDKQDHQRQRLNFADLRNREQQPIGDGAEQYGPGFPGRAIEQKAGEERRGQHDESRAHSSRNLPFANHGSQSWA